MSPHDEMDDQVARKRTVDAAVGQPLRVDWRSPFDELGYVFDCDDVEFESFAELRKYVLHGLGEQIGRLSGIAEQVRDADCFEDLELGWWSPLIERVGDGEGE